MKKLTCFILCISLLLFYQTGTSQSSVQKSLLSPSRGNHEMRFTVEATVMDNDSWCLISWPWPAYPWEYAYDDDEADDFMVYQNPGSQHANKFSPFAYPVIVTGGRIFVGDGSFPGPFLGSSFRIIVYDDNGENGFPGTALDSMDVSVINYGWVEFEGMTAQIEEGDFYLAMKQLAPAPNAAPVGVDTDVPTYFISYSKYGNNSWNLSPLQDFMIRALVNGYYEPSREIENFEVSRFSGFDLNGSPLLGDTTVLDTVYESSFEDYSWEDLPPGYYAYGIKTHFTSSGWSDYDVSNIVSHGLYFYTPECFYQSDTGSMPLVVCPPLNETDSVPENFLGYNLYFDNEWLAFLLPETSSFDPAVYFPGGLDPGTFSFSLTALYDLSQFGYPGETSESVILTSAYFLRYGYPLDFLESWDDGSFGANSWSSGGDNWSVSGNEGNPFPSATFSGNPALENYFMALESYPFLADSMTEGKLFLDFDARLDNASASGTEYLNIQAWDWQSRAWSTVYTYSNASGSFDWISAHLDISAYAMNRVFRLRFAAEGENSENLLAWHLDNIHVYRFCSSPLSLEVNGAIDGMHLDWNGIETNQWMHWDDGLNSGIGIGTGGSAEFDVAVRWTSEQLAYFDGDTLTDVGFFPIEEAATYRIRVWIGPGAANLIYDTEVDNPIIGQWNYISLIYPVMIDSDLELWVGYNVDTPEGHPAGVDNGPAIDGYGNMINFGGWQTLLQNNPNLDYNWNIMAYLRHNMDGHQIKYAIYRSDDLGPYYLRDRTDHPYYDDDSVCMLPPFYHSYKITALYIFGNDTCESDYSNEASDNCTGIPETQKNSLKIYPNPASDVIYVESTKDIEGVEVIDGRGEVVKRNRGDKGMGRQGDGETRRIGLTGLAPGLYLVRVVTAGGIVTEKVLIVK
jgi:hypothetical protein